MNYVVLRKYIIFIKNKWIIFMVITILLFIIFTNFFVMKRLKKKLKISEINYNSAINSANILTITINKSGKLISYNQNFAKLFNFPCNNNSRHLHDIIGTGKMKLLELLIMIDNNEPINNFEIKLVNNRNKIFNIKFTSKKYDTDIIDSIELVGIDITKHLEIEENLKNTKEELKQKKVLLEDSQRKLLENETKIWDFAYTDHLMKIYNKSFFQEKTSEILKDSKKIFAMILIDIDNIGYCYNIFGPDKTDEIIYDIATRIYKMTRKGNIVAKIGSSEFAILLMDMNFDEINEYLEELIELNILDVKYEGVTLHISISAGISIYPYNGQDYNTLVKTASIALKNAKDTGQAKCVFYNEIMESKLLEKMNIESSIRDGINHDRFFLVYQPQYNMTTGDINGFEALLRLKETSGSIIPPGRFINVAEETKLIIPLGYWVIHQACEFILRMHKRGIKHLAVSVNVSVMQFLQDDFVDNIKNILNKYQINPKYFEIEITETSIMNLNEQNLDKICDLRQYGINISIDDFGTGYSSLLYFKKTSDISALKIDREFVKDIGVNENNTEIVDAIIYLSHKFNLKVVAEGVETVEQFKILSKIGCDTMQGYLGSKPLAENLIYEDYNSLININNKIN